MKRKKLTDHQFPECRKRAIECHYEVCGQYKRTLRCAMEAGKNLYRIKKHLGHKHWGPWVDNDVNFPASRRTAGNYTRVYRLWDQIEPELERNPDLSIRGALHFVSRSFLRNKEPGRGKTFSGDIKDRVNMDKQFAKMRREETAHWTDEEKQALSESAFDPEIDKVRKEVFEKIRMCVKRTQGIKFTKNKIEQELRKATERYRLRISAQREADPSYELTEGDVLPMEHDREHCMMN